MFRHGVRFTFAGGCARCKSISSGLTCTTYAGRPGQSCPDGQCISGLAAALNENPVWKFRGLESAACPFA
jgi:hypothetical protein